MAASVDGTLAFAAQVAEADSITERLVEHRPVFPRHKILSAAIAINVNIKQMCFGIEGGKYADVVLGCVLFRSLHDVKW